MQTVKVEIWDLPTRLFHWLLVFCVFGAIATGLVGGEWIELHAKFGIFCVGLIVFRVLLGFIGGYYSRFLQFFPTPKTLLQYLQGKWHGLGHNPFGAFSVFALLGLVGFQSVSGLFTNDDITLYGPLFKLVSKETSDFITGWHTTIVYVLMAFIVLHILAIMFYRIVKKDNLVKPMITGFKEIDGGEANKAAIQENIDNNEKIKCGAGAMTIAVTIALISLLFASGTMLKNVEINNQEPTEMQTETENQNESSNENENENENENIPLPQKSEYDW